jgi:hypothetical protein
MGSAVAGPYCFYKKLTINYYSKYQSTIINTYPHLITHNS